MPSRMQEELAEVAGLAQDLNARADEAIKRLTNLERAFIAAGTGVEAEIPIGDGGFLGYRRIPEHGWRIVFRRGSVEEWVPAQSASRLERILAAEYFPALVSAVLGQLRKQVNRVYGIAPP